MKRSILLVVLLLSISFLFSQEIKKEFKPNGKAFVKVFANYNSTFSDSEVFNAFEIQRAYFGYDFKISKEFSGKVTLDIGNPSDGGKLSRTAYLKTAYFQYKKDRLKVKFGLIGRNQFKMQESMWGVRYLYKSYMDEFKLGSSADAGVFVSYKIHDVISIDAAVENGEGYKSLEMDSVFKYSAGITISPITGLDIRLYTDIMGKEDAQKTYAGYVGYSVKNLKIGAEYNYQINNKLNADENFGGYSFYASYKTKKYRPFARYDIFRSTTLDGKIDPWNYNKDGQGVLAGIEFAPIKGIKISPNYQAWFSDSDAAARHSIYLNCEIKF